MERMAADFFENSLRHAQSQRIAAETAQTYREMDKGAQASFKSSRRTLWECLSAEQRQRWRDQKKPSYWGLSEQQKDEFRNIARRQLDASSSKPGI